MKRARNILEPPVGVTLDYSNNTLIAKGAADHRWISSFRQKAGGIPGVVLVDEDNLTDNSISALTLARNNLEGLRLLFPLGKAELSDGQDSVFQEVIEIIHDIQELQQIINDPVRIIITGNTDPSGSELLNLQLSRQRADAVLAILIKNGIQPEYITAVGSFDSNRQIEQHPGSAGLDGSDGSDHAFNRNVTFRTSMFER